MHLLLGLSSRSLVLAALAVLVTIYCAHVAPRAVGAQMRRVPHVDANLDLLVRRATAWAIWLIGLAFAATALGFGVAGAVTAGGATVVLGLACQNYLTNLIDGTALLTERDFEIGDTIGLPTMGGIGGKVIDMKVRRTKLSDANGTLLVIPNSDLFNNPMTVIPQIAKEQSCHADPITTLSSPSSPSSPSSQAHSAAKPSPNLVWKSGLPPRPHRQH